MKNTEEFKKQLMVVYGEEKANKILNASEDLDKRIKEKVIKYNWKCKNCNSQELSYIISDKEGICNLECDKCNTITEIDLNPFLTDENGNSIKLSDIKPNQYFYLDIPVIQNPITILSKEK